MSIAADENALRYLTADQVVELCAEIDPLDVVTDAFLSVRRGSAAVAPEAALRWTAPDGAAARSLILPAYYNGAYGSKIINASLGNTARGLPRAHGLIALYDPLTAVPVCLMDAGHVSALRTAAVSVAALRAVRDLSEVRHVALLGSGRQARTHLSVLAPRAGVREVSVFDTDPARAGEFAEWAARHLPDVRVEVAPTAEAAVRAAPVTVAATTTTTSYVAAAWLPAGGVFLNVSLDDATEDLLLTCDHLFVDDWELVSEDETRLLGRLAHAGRVTGPDEPAPSGGRAVDADLATLLAGAYPRPITPDDRVVINPFGMGVHDIALASHIHTAAREREVGTLLPR
jgi:ornithine cyclodeaminase